MFGMFRDQWTVSKGIREIAVMGERDGLLRPDKREHIIKAILEFSRDAGIVRKGVPVHEQVMIAVMAFFGIAAGSIALSDAAKWGGICQPASSARCARHVYGDSYEFD